MANGDILRQLFRAYARRDDAEMRLAVDTLIQEERAKNHRLLADDLERILLSADARPERGATRLVREKEIPRDRESGFPLIEVEHSRYDWDWLIVSAKIRSSLEQIAKEHYQRDVLAASGLKPKQRILFYGPPGCGKTLAARVLAGVLGYPLAIVRFDAVVSSLLGETAANLRRVFEYVQTGQWVVLFDEFDAIGKDRDNPFEHGELKRLVNTLLQLVDAFQGESLLLAATNHEQLLDAALWRRFEAVIAFTLPTEGDRLLIMRRFLRSYDYSNVSLPALARRLKGATGADLEWIATEAVRRVVLDRKRCLSGEDLEPAIAAYRERLVGMRGSSPAPEHALPEADSGSTSSTVESWRETATT
jgi:SpoVK/Ycf46/Vps4 family AAA+-type ATPase